MLHDHIKKIIEWTKLKVRLHIAADRDLYFREREVWWTSLGANIGDEQNGKHDQFERPVLIIKKFGRNTFCGLPLSSRTKVGPYYSAFRMGNTMETVIFSQIRTMSCRRLLRKMGMCSVEDFSKIISILKNIF
ncbi:MAG: type II toxin-antitoxin system PemK/MazF family toxin [Candidatus Uhrbacteria bacterium]|nr:type II toxin-antitoxin system PemK/MazF family toxin [Candidatus Uhrbacteria bacterium]